MRKNLIKATLLASVCAVGLSACETMDTAWDDVTGESTPYAGDIQPQQQPMMAPPMQPMAQQQPMYQQQPMMAQQPVVPASAMQPTMQYPQQMAQQPMMQQQMQPMQQQAYTPNLASVPPRPMASELPSQQQVQAARQELNSDNQMLTGYLRDPRGNTTATMQPAPMQQGTQTYVQQSPASTMPPAAAAQQASNLIEGQLMGLQQTSGGQYALVPLAPEAPLGGFSLASSVYFRNDVNNISMPQYQQLKSVAGQYAMQPGRVRVVSYGDAQNSKALQSATTTAAYLVDMGVPANAIRVKIDGSAASSPMGQSKTDIFLETPVQR
ncbi:MAG TPA: hypothetical protein PKW15_02395 [Alphaproteobacteria bacterium]|nr:hypothetical protein [Rhodospirillaceae bacterium]HRJ12075.1 hypothetical protein [Alphaproteobacteria bacterium]